MQGEGLTVSESVASRKGRILMEHRKVMTITLGLNSNYGAAREPTSKMMGDTPVPAEKAGVSSGDRQEGQGRKTESRYSSRYGKR